MMFIRNNLFQERECVAGHTNRKTVIVLCVVKHGHARHVYFYFSSRRRVLHNIKPKYL